MKRLTDLFTLCTLFTLVLAFQEIDAYKRKHSARHQGDSEECDERGRPLHAHADRQPPPHRRDMEDDLMMQGDMMEGLQDLWPMDEPGFAGKGFQEWGKDDFWPDMTDHMEEVFNLLIRGGDFGIKNGWNKEWTLDQLQKEIKQKRIGPKAAQKIIQGFLQTEDEYKRMVDKMSKMKGRKRDDSPPAGPPYKTIMVVLCAVLGVVLLLVVGVVVYRRAGLRARVAPPTDVSDSSEKYAVPPRDPDGGKEPLPSYPAYIIAGVPPPDYTLATAMGGPSGDYDDPPTYSTIDLQNDASDVTVVNVKPM